MTERKAFEHLPASENPQFFEDGMKIYSDLRNKYPHKTVEDLDNILNGLCSALTILMNKNVDKSNYKQFLHLIWNILNKQNA